MRTPRPTPRTVVAGPAADLAVDPAGRRACLLALAGMLAGPALAQDIGRLEGPTAKALPLVLLETTLGRVVVLLDMARAPLSSADFLRYVNQGLYDGASFYRSVRRDNDHGSPGIEVVQGGLADDTQALPPVAHEPTSRTGLLHRDGTLSLARGAPGTGGGAAFFICVGDQPGLDAGAARNPDLQGFAAFGQVVTGMDVVRRIHAAETDPERGDAYVRGQLLREPVRIVKAVLLP